MVRFSVGAVAVALQTDGHPRAGVPTERAPERSHTHYLLCRDHATGPKNNDGSGAIQSRTLFQYTFDTLQYRFQLRRLTVRPTPHQSCVVFQRNSCVLFSTLSC
eukprot:scaffold1168_cov167-Amphora_coffeaeformis.AAC.8